MQQQNKQSYSSLQQQQVGIVSYISSGKPILAVSKYMVTDFIVNQIQQNGNIVTLKTKPDYTNIPKKDKKQQKPCYIIEKDVLEGITKYFGESAAHAISQLYTRLQAGQKINQWEYTVSNMPIIPKTQRTKIHEFVRNNLINIQSNTMNSSTMRLKMNKKLKKSAPQTHNKYIHFTLLKSNIDTMGAIYKLSKLTNINQKLFSTAGLKDKRGITMQMISVYNTSLHCLQQFYYHANKNKQIWIGNFVTNLNYDVGIGNLWGNQFGLIIRLIDAKDDKEIQKRINSLKQIGMINYFGMQRFGSCNTKTYMIGYKLIKRQWKQLIQQLLLQKTSNEQINNKKQQYYYNQQYAKGQKQLPNIYKIQKNIFHALNKYGKNYQNIFQHLPRSIKMLYIHSLQSYLFNHIVNKRIKSFGINVVKGDLVGKKASLFQKTIMEMQQQKHQNQHDKQAHQDLDQQQQNDQQSNHEQQQQQQRYQVQLVTQQTKHHYQITDVLMPLYGPLINIPKQSLAFIYLQEQLQLIGLSQDDFNHSKCQKLCFKGMFRKIVVKPIVTKWNLIQHKSGKDQLQSPFYTIGQEAVFEKGMRKAVQLVIQLPKSSYATIALREILHVPSSFQFQMKLNKLYQQQKDIPQTQQQKQQNNEQDKRGEIKLTQK